MSAIKNLIYRALRRSEVYTKTDMVHFFSINVWLNVSRIFSIGTGMLLTISFANILSPEVFGTYKYVIASAGFIATFSLNGLTTSIMRAAAQGKTSVIPAVVNYGIRWSIPTSLVALGMSGYYFVHSNSDLGFAFLFIAITNSISNGIGSTKGVWYAVGQFKEGTLFGIPKILIPFTVILITLWSTQNVVWILLAYFASNLLISWASYLWMLRWLHIKKTSDSDPDVKETILYGKQLSLLGFFQLAGGQIDQLLLWHFTDPATLVLYSLALTPVNEARNLLNNFLPIVFNKIANKTKEELYRILPFRTGQMFLISVVTTIAYITLIPILFTYVFPKYIASTLISQILALIILFVPRGLIDTFFITHGEVGKRSKIILIGQSIKFILLCTLIPLFGVWGAVWATILNEIVLSFAYWLLFLRR